jgi:hypothetical protein
LPECHDDAQVGLGSLQGFGGFDIAHGLGPEQGEALGQGALGDGRRRTLAAAPPAPVGLAHDGDHAVTAREQAFEAGERQLGRTEEGDPE